ncbi:amino acid permease-domain-containing protein [Paraphoma chrysanthemicola]|uniref:Amino acid permease-domain-containing protein n=1 Tax=Paraphoma chrysanthemicola TaxID=798071 RepID=A0A8K0R814_9PLEO|nr:amino acid permease-domain-containing protein [Paraphoma chrysanthemicola]
MHHDLEVLDETRSIRSDRSSFCLDEDDRRYLEALKGRDYVVTKNTRNPLGLFSVVAFILQQVIGTGIFRTPWTAIHASESVGTTLLFWLFGAVTAMAGTVLYIEFGLTLPRHIIDGQEEPVVRNGGDLNYVHYLLKRPKFLVLSFYAINYIFLASSAANALSFGDDVVGGQGTDRGALRDAAARGIAILAVTFPCFLHAFTRRGGILLNNVFVVVKVAILCTFPIMAICVLCGVADTNHAAENLNPKHSFANARSDVDSYTQGILAVFYAYSGYNQANYVLCEIEKPRRNFKRGIIYAVGTICVLYMLVNLSYMVVVSKEQQLNSSDIALQFLTNIMGQKHAERLLAGFTTISTLGNIIGMTYTASKVKQEIAKEGIIPFAKFFGENRVLFANWRRKHRSEDPEPTPLGALFLHWLFAVILILLTWAAKPASAYRILVNLYVYLMDIVPSFIMAIGMLYLRFFTRWSTKSLMPSWLSILAAFIYALANGFPLVAIWIPPTHTSTDVYDLIPGFPWYMTGTLSWTLLACGVVYWIGFRYVLPRYGARKGKEFLVEREPVFRMQDGERVQWHEIVLQSWVVKTEPEKSSGYVLNDF